MGFTSLFMETSWTRYLKGKRVVVVHPFKESILTQNDSERCYSRSLRCFQSLNPFQLSKPYNQ